MQVMPAKIPFCCNQIAWRCSCGAKRCLFQITWQGTRTARRVAPQNYQHLQTLPGETTPPQGACVPVIFCYRSYRLAGPTPPLGATPVVV